jgi:hypothetical protein
MLFQVPGATLISSHGNDTRFGRMFVLSVAPLGPHQNPTIYFNQSDGIPNFWHESSPLPIPLPLLTKEELSF